MDLKLAGRTAVVTGGSRGIGRVIVETLAAEGCTVATCARDASVLSDAAAAWHERGFEITTRALDVRDREGVSDWLAEVAAASGRVDILIANVSAFPGRNTPSDWRLGFEVDLMGTINPVDAALPYLVESGDGAVVVIGSTAAVDPMGPGRPYDVYKAALVTYVKSLCLTYAGDGVRFNTVSPGTIFFPGGRWDHARRENPSRYEHYLGRNPMGRMGTPEEVARAVVFLASPASSFTTGANLIVDGGFTRRVQL